MQVFDGEKQLGGELWDARDELNGTKSLDEDHGIWAMNEVNIHRGQNPHMAVVEVYVDGRFLTEAVVGPEISFAYRSMIAKLTAP